MLALFDLQAGHRIDPLGVGTDVGVQAVQRGRASGLDGGRSDGEQHGHLRLGVQVPQRSSFVSLIKSYAISAFDHSVMQHAQHTCQASCIRSIKGRKLIILANRMI